jgi:hypothetical protein
MIVRLGTVALLTGLCFATPSLAETLVRDSDLSMDLREGEVAMPVAPDLAALDEIFAQLAVVEVPGPLVEPGVQLSETPAVEPVAEAAAPLPTNVLAERDDAENFSWTVADLASADLTNVLAQRDEAENFSWTVADLASADLTTGSIAGDSGELPFQPVTGDHAEFAAAAMSAQPAGEEPDLTMAP